MKRKKKAIVQKHYLGCVVACVAFVLNTTYSNSLKLFKNGKTRAERKGFYCRETVKVLNSLNKYCRYKYIKNSMKKNIYKDKTIIFVGRSKKYPSGHYLCRYNNLWMDPWINFPKNKNIKKAEASFRKRLPGKPIYGIFFLVNK